jgi:trigger factor
LTKTCGNLGRFSRFCSRTRILGQPHSTERKVMKVSVEDISSVKKKLHVEIPQEDVAKEINKFYNKLQKSVKLKGFRPGKVPRSVLENRFKKEVVSEVSAQLISMSYPKALQENNIAPLGNPNFDYPELVAGQEYKYSATVDVKPPVTINEYTGLKLTKTIYVVSDDKIEEKLKTIQRNQAQLKTIDADRPVRAGDFVQIDYEGLKDGKPFDPVGKTENFIAEVGSEKLLKEVSDQLIGMTRGETKTFPVKFPDDYVPKNLAGEEVSFTVTVKEIKEQILQEINDEFAKDLGQFSSLEELKSAIRKEMERNFNNFSERELYEQLIDKLIEKTDFELPDILVDHETQGMAKDAEAAFGSQNLSLQDMGYTQKALLEKYRPAAKRKVRGLLILDKIIEQEGFKINDEILNAGFENLSKKLGQPVESLKMVYNQDKQQAANLDQKFLEEHAIKFIIDNSTVEDVEPDSK